MKIKCLILLGVIFTSCVPQTESNKKVTTEDLVSQDIKNHGIQILTIDSCEYVWVKNGYGAGLTHKGNCKFCKKEEVVESRRTN